MQTDLADLIPDVEVKESPLPGITPKVGQGEEKNRKLEVSNRYGIQVPPELGDQRNFEKLIAIANNPKLLSEDMYATNSNDGNGHPAAIDALNPQGETANESEWEKRLNNYIKKEDQFLYRLENSILTSSDVSLICDTLEGSGEEGLSLDVFASRLRLLESDLVDLALKYPRLEKSIRLTRVKRKGFFLQTMVMTGHKSTATMRELFESDKVNKDLLQVREEKQANTKLEEELVSDLRNLGVKPAEYTSIQYVVGDLENVDDLPNPVEGMKELNNNYMTVGEVRDILSSRLDTKGVSTGEKEGIDLLSSQTPSLGPAQPSSNQIPEVRI